MRLALSIEVDKVTIETLNTQQVLPEAGVMQPEGRHVQATLAAQQIQKSCISVH